jgi:hypothetical protein
MSVIFVAAPPASAASYQYVLSYNYSSGDLSHNTFLHRSAIHGYDDKFYTAVQLTCRADGWLTVDYYSVSLSRMWAQPSWHLSAADTVNWSKFSSIGQDLQMTMNSQGCSWYVRIYAWLYR